MRYIRAFLMSLGMFSAIPTPNIWEDRLMPMMLPCLPVIGALIGVIWYGIIFLLRLANVPPLIQGALAMLAPFALCGFLHADGYMDASDAIFSRRGIEDKKRILKDPNVGAFGVIAIVIAFLLQFSAMVTVTSTERNIYLIICIPILSRCIAGAAMLNCRAMFEIGFAASFKADTKPVHTVFICLFALFPTVAAGFLTATAIIVILTEVLAGILATAWTYRQFYGLSGDLCGFIITVSELAGVLCMAIIA